MNSPLAEARGRIVDGLLVSLAILGLPAVLLSWVVVREQLGLWASVGPALAYLPMLVGALGRRRLSLRARTLLVVLPLLGLSFQSTLSFGLPGAEILLLAVVAVLTTTLLGLRWGLLSLVAGLVSMGLAGALLVTEVAAVPRDIGDHLFEASTWISATLNTGVLVALMVLTIGLVERQLHRRSDELATANDLLLREVQARESLEGHLVHAQRAEALSTLAGGVAHDLNNLLTVVQANTSLALMDLDDQGPLRDALEGAHQAAQGASALVERLLAFARLQVLEPRVLDLREVVGRTRPMLERLVGEAVRIHLEPAPRPLPVKADPTQLQRVLVNLMANARDATPQGGQVHLSLGVQELAPGPDGAYAYVEVRDHGEGMSLQTRLRAFEPFYTTKAQGQGTGLGLSAVEGIVHQHGGQVQLESEPGEGTRVRVLLPLTNEAVQSMISIPPTQELPNCGDRVVMVVDDQPLVRRAAARALERLGLEVLEANGGPQALALAAARQGPIHLLLTDVVMPDMDGRELARRLSLARPQTAILFTSGHPRDVLSAQGGLDEGVRLLRKPFSPQDLAEAVSTALGDASSQTPPGPIPSP